MVTKYHYMYYNYVFLYQTFVKNKCVIWKVTEIVINTFFGIQHSRTIIWPGGSNENHSTYIVWTATAGGLDIRPARVKGTLLKGGYPISFASNVFHNSHLIQKCIQNQQQLLILYTLLNQMRVVKNIRHKDDRMNSL